jgi:H+/Cl- antiporter ClcA
MVEDGGGRRWRDREAALGGLLLLLLLGVLVLAFAVLFEAVIGLGGRSPGGQGRYSLAALLILAGLVLLGRRLLMTRRP